MSLSRHPSRTLRRKGGGLLKKAVAVLTQGYCEYYFTLFFYTTNIVFFNEIRKKYAPKMGGFPKDFLPRGWSRRRLETACPLGEKVGVGIPLFFVPSPYLFR